MIKIRSLLVIIKVLCKSLIDGIRFRRWWASSSSPSSPCPLRSTEAWPDHHHPLGPVRLWAVDGGRLLDPFRFGCPLWTLADAALSSRVSSGIAPPSLQSIPISPPSFGCGARRSKGMGRERRKKASVFALITLVSIASARLLSERSDRCSYEYRILVRFKGKEEDFCWYRSLWLHIVLKDLIFAFGCVTLRVLAFFSSFLGFSWVLYAALYAVRIAQSFAWIEAFSVLINFCGLLYLTIMWISCTRCCVSSF